jgi:hypothetical protein
MSPATPDPGSDAASPALAGLLATATPPPEPDPLVGAVVVLDTDLPDAVDPGLPLAVRISGGAGQIAGPAALCARRGLRLASVTTTLRDHDDLLGNARRVVAAVDAARAEGVLGDDVAIRVALPVDHPGHGWLAAADEVAAMEWQLALPLRTGDHAVPGTMLADWLEAALDREIPFAATGATAPSEVIGVLLATARAWDGAGTDVAATTWSSRDDNADAAALATGHRWCRSVELAAGMDPTAVGDVLRAAFDQE